MDTDNAPDQLAADDSAPAAADRATPATLILLVRHGVTPTTGQILPGRAPGLHLSETGQKQAREAAERLAGLPLTAIYSSPMERAQETAAPIAEAFGLDPMICDGLIECDFGEWTGEKLTELTRLPEWRTVQKNPSAFRFPAGESFTEMQERMVASVADVADRYRGRVVACVSHADPIKTVIAHFSGSSLDAFQRFSADPAAITAIELAADGSSRMLVTNSRTGSLRYLREEARP